MILKMKDGNFDLTVKNEYNCTVQAVQSKE